MKNKKKICPECGHILENGICRNCFLKNIENADIAIQKHKTMLKNVNAEVKRSINRSIGLLIFILGIVFMIGFGIGFYWGLCQ